MKTLFRCSLLGLPAILPLLSCAATAHAQAEIDDIAKQIFTRSQGDFKLICQNDAACINQKLEATSARFTEHVWNPPAPDAWDTPTTQPATTEADGSPGALPLSLPTSANSSSGGTSFAFTSSAAPANSGRAGAAQPAARRAPASASPGSSDVCNFTALNPDCSLLPSHPAGPARKVSMGADTNGCKIGSACAYPEETCQTLVAAKPCPPGNHYVGSSRHPHGCEQNSYSCQPDESPQP